MLFPCVVSLYHTLFVNIYGLISLSRLDGFLWTGENFILIAPLEIYFLITLVTCSILILPTVYKYLGIPQVNRNHDKKARRSITAK